MIDACLVFQKPLHHFPPFLLQTISRPLPSRPVVPIIGIPDVPFLAVQIGVYPGTFFGMDILGDVVRSIPIPAAFVPKGQEQ